MAEDLGRQIREARQRATLTQAELAERLSVSTRAVQFWEAGVSIPRPKHRRALAAFAEEQAA